MSVIVSITVTSQGQTTIPVAMRRKLGLAAAGGVLMAHFDERKNELVLSKPIDVVHLSERISRHIKPGTVPILDVDEYYQMQREVTS